MDIRQIQTSIQNNKIRISNHAKEEMLNGNFELDDILYSVTSDGEIIEEYPQKIDYLLHA